MANNMVDIVAVKNITKERQVFHYNYSEDKTDYVFEPGQVSFYPRYAADHFAEHIIDAWLNENPKYLPMINNRQYRDTLKNQIFVQEIQSNRPPIMTAEQIAMNEARAMNTPTPAPEAPQEQEFENLAKTVEPVVIADDPAPETTEPAARQELTKEMLVAYAKKTGMNTEDEKFKILVEMSPPEALAIALGYEQ